MPGLTAAPAFSRRRDVQLVLYPLLDLAQHTKDLHWYMRQLEEVVIRALWEVRPAGAC